MDNDELNIMNLDLNGSVSNLEAPGNLENVVHFLPKQKQNINDFNFGRQYYLGSGYSRWSNDHDLVIEFHNVLTETNSIGFDHHFKIFL